MKGGQEEAWKFIDALQIFSLLANVADVKSLVIHPYTTTHSQLSPEELAEQHITPSTVRLSIGTEHIDDIIDDRHSMRNYIIADNQELTAYALQSLLKRDEGSAVFRAVDKSGLTELLKEHEDAVVFLDYTLFDFADEDQLLIVAERFSLSEWILISDELTPQFVRRVVYSSPDE